MTHKKATRGWGSMTEKERSIEMTRRMALARARKKDSIDPAHLTQSDPISDFIDNPSLSMTKIDEKIDAEVQRIHDLKQDIQLAEIKIARLQKLRSIFSVAEVQTDASSIA